MRWRAESPPAEGGERSALVRYRVVGGAADVDQRLTVFDDGHVELLLRHRRGSEPVWAQLDSANLKELRSAIAQLPEDRWSRLPKLALIQAGRGILSGLLPGSQHRRIYFELRQGDRVIAGDEHDELHSSAAVTRLDSLRADAVRAYPR
jgi:hypothetical protein